MTMDDFLNSTPEDIKEAVERKTKGKDLADEISVLTKDVAELERQLEAVKSEINAWLEDYNNGLFDGLAERVDDLKNGVEEKTAALKEKREELEKKQEEYKELVEKEEKDKKREKISSKIKSAFNKLKINKEEGLKATKKAAKTVGALGAFIVIKGNEKLKAVATNVKEKANSAKEWVKDDLKKGVVYNTAEFVKEKAPAVVETVKEKAPEVAETVKENVSKAKLKVDKARSAIATAPKKAIGGIKSAFAKVSEKIGNARKVVVAAGTRFANIVKETVSDEVEYIKDSSEINRKKKEQLEAYKKHLEEEARALREEARNKRKTGMGL